MLLGTPSLLIADDDRDFRETLREVFEVRGFRTVLAADGVQALQIARSQPIHLLLTDMHMPRLSGLEMIRQMRELRLPVPCILLSARLDQVLAEEARRVEVFSFLSKPVSSREITQTVTRAMRDTYGWPQGG